MTSVVLCVTNDLFYDRRLQKIGGTLQAAGYEVTLVGRKPSLGIQDRQPPYQRHWLPCFFQRGVFFYLEFQIRLLIYLLRVPKSILCANDLDTMPAVYLASVFRKLPRVTDAHELFTEQKEVVSRPLVHRIWLLAERWLVPRFPMGYTVNEQLAHEFNRRYGVRYEVIRNVPLLVALPAAGKNQADKWIIYQGAVNEGRCFEQLIPAMKEVPVPLKIYGTGNFLLQVQQLIQAEKLEEKVVCIPPVLPEQLVHITPAATIGITLFEKKGLNQYWSLANRFFDYIMAGIPQICSDFPAYQAIMDRYPVGLLVDSSDPRSIADALNKLLSDDVLYEKCKNACLDARKELNWENERDRLLAFYAKLL
ncbi:MAG: glycosyltransferase [Bacteroidota bacterium]|jgi:glycosyltransferase involved in cell wall biosynthesis